MANLPKIRALAEAILAEAAEVPPPSAVAPSDMTNQDAIEWAMRCEPPSRVWSPKVVAARLEAAGRPPRDPSTDMWDMQAAGRLRRVGWGKYQLNG
jgi:hypothetical protein